MSQIINAPVTVAPLEALQLQMIANGTTTNSGATYDLDLGDENVFQVNLQSGSSITLDSGSPHELNLAAGLYQISFAGWVQTTATTYGDFDMELIVSTDSTFVLKDVLYDRQKLWYGNGSSGNTTPIIDNNHTIVFNAAVATTLYFRIEVTNAPSTTWYLRGDGLGNALTTLDVVRLGDALS